jgi:hypothetical protein
MVRYTRQRMLYEAIFSGLHGAQVRYLVVGAVAVNLHGVPRMTADLDLMVDLAETNLRQFVDTIVGLGYRPRVPVEPIEFVDPRKRQEWRENKSMVMFTWIHPTRRYEEIDVFLDNPIDFADAYARRQDVPVQDFTVPLSSVMDLIAMKRMADREQDRSDIEALTRLSQLDQGEQT